MCYSARVIQNRGVCKAEAALPSATSKAKPRIYIIKFDKFPSERPECACSDVASRRGEFQDFLDLWG